MNYEINNLKIIVKDEVIDNIKKSYWSNLKYYVKIHLYGNTLKCTRSSGSGVEHG